MKIHVFVNEGVQSTARNEIKRRLDIDATQDGRVLTFDVDSAKQLLAFAAKTQSIQFVTIGIAQAKELQDISFYDIALEKLFKKENKHKLTIEGVQGQHNRDEIIKTVLGKISGHIQSNIGFEPTFEFKNPDVEVKVLKGESSYYFGIDIMGKDLTSREYRVFSHPASFRGDLGFYFIDKVGYTKEDQLLVAFCKDGVVAIEAALSQNNISLVDLEEPTLSFHKIPLLSDIGLSIIEKNYLSSSKNDLHITAFDSGSRNITAAAKNAKLAQIREKIKITQLSLDELDFKFQEKSFSKMIMYVTRKDEDNINEIYYQAAQILKPSATFLLIGRTGWEISPSNRFTCVEESILSWGKNSQYKLWCMQRKADD